MPDLASELLSVAEAERALVAAEVTLEHSLAMCPVLLQNRQRFCLKWRCRSACVSLPSFLSSEERSGLGFFWLLLLLPALALLELPELPELLFPPLLFFIFIGILSVCFFIALPFIVRVLVLVGGQVFSGHLGAALPISGVNGLGEGTEFVEGVRFADVGNLILDVGQKSTIHLSVEGGVAPLDTGS